jgi:hypothetical protein
MSVAAVDGVCVVIRAQQEVRRSSIKPSGYAANGRSRATTARFLTEVRAKLPQMVRRTRAFSSAFALALSQALLACSSNSDSGSDDGTGGAGSGYQAIPHTTCPEGSAPADPDALFARHGGTYAFVPGTDMCGMDDVRLTIDRRYTTRLTLEKEIVAASNDREWMFTWDGIYDLACESSFTSLVEIGSEAGFVRAVFIGDDPATFLFGLCICDLVQ